MCRIYFLILVATVLTWGQSYNLPLFMVNTQGQEIKGDPETYGTLKVVNNASGVNQKNDPATDYQGNIHINVRGQSSSAFPKKGYALKLRENPTTSVDASLLGLPEEHDWVLHGPFVDKTLFRNVIAHRLYQQTGRYSPRTRMIELFINDEYQGVYVLLEKIKRDKDRVAIKKVDSTVTSGDELSGGYIFRVDKINSIHRDRQLVDYGFSTRTENVNIRWHYPKRTRINEPQKNYLKNYINNFESVLAGNDWSSQYPNVLDVDAAVDYIMHQELTKNSDAYWSSFFMHKERDSKGGKLILGPPWDFNLSLGASSLFSADRVEGWAFDVSKGGGGGGMWGPPNTGGGNTHYDDTKLGVDKMPSWIAKVFKDNYFQTKAKARWAELRSGVWHSKHIDDFIDSLITHVGPAADRNIQKWPLNQSAGMFAMYVTTRSSWNDGSTRSEIGFMRDWIKRRMNWMDGQFGFTEPVNPTSPPLNTDPPPPPAPPVPPNTGNPVVPDPGGQTNPNPWPGWGGGSTPVLTENPETIKPKAKIYFNGKSLVIRKEGRENEVREYNIKGLRSN
ncbi:MAG: hypothetical protein GX801_08145 [Fibrobacter sp.]|nr:hypothetical protein [Fibrobacter sp.]